MSFKNTSVVALGVCGALVVSACSKERELEITVQKLASGTLVSEMNKVLFDKGTVGSPGILEIPSVQNETLQEKIQRAATLQFLDEKAIRYLS
jgi:hypothetical protein